MRSSPSFVPPPNDSLAFNSIVTNVPQGYRRMRSDSRNGPSGGKLTGYAGGLDKKQWLIEWEASTAPVVEMPSALVSL
jgi:hypothetical protein